MINTLEDIQRLVVAGYTNWQQHGLVNTSYHQEEPYVLFNYNKLAQIEANWTPFECLGRGLIINHQTGEVIARSYDKFFNWGEYGTSPGNPGKILSTTEKVDGSLGVLYRTKNGYRIASRGSFYGKQAVWGNEILQQHNIDVPNELTPIFEIIHPENRVVVDYKDRKELVLLDLRNRFTGEYLSQREVEKFANKFDFSLPKRYTFNNVNEILSSAREIPPDQEGWVVKFEDGSRWKFKGDEYRRVHRIISRFLFKNILEAVKDRKIQEVLNSVPDNFLDPVYDALDKIEKVVEGTKKEVETYFASAPREDRKSFALWVAENCKHLSPYMFALLDGRDIDCLIYKFAFRNKEKEEIS